MPDDEINKITHENACRWYSFDQFAHLPRQESTVAALRAAAAGHDVSVRSFDHGRFERQVGVRVADLAAKASA